MSAIKRVATPALLFLCLACLSVLLFIAVRGYRERGEIVVPARFVNLRGQMALNFSVKTLDGSVLGVPNRERPTVVEILATWCEDCQREVAAMNKFVKQHPEFAVIGVVGDKLGQDQRPETESDIRAFVRRYHVHYPVTTLPYTSIANEYQTWGYPSLVFVRKDGVIEINTAGDVPYATIVAAAKETVRDNGVPVKPGPAVFPTP